MNTLRTWIRKSAASLCTAATLSACGADSPTDGFSSEDTNVSVRTSRRAGTALVDLGRSLYNDKTLSRNRNQSCASCHAPQAGFAGTADGTLTEGFPGGPTPGMMAFFEGSIRGRFGDRKPPSSAYASFVPPRRESGSGEFEGGLFWDGRAAGSAELRPIEEQALGPLQAGKEHAFSRVCVLWEIQKSSYRDAFNALSPTKLTSIPFTKIGEDAVARDEYCHTGTDDLPATPPNFTAEEATNLTNAYNYVGVAIGAFESSPEVNRFSSRYDDEEAGRIRFTKLEEDGHDVFDEHCETCHESDSGPETFNDYRYYNLGVPRNPLRRTLVDRGLGAVVNDRDLDGFFRNVTTRNVDKRLPGVGKAYMHNGVFTSLEEVVHFYNTRDTKRCPAGVTFVRFPTNADPVAARRQGICWPAPDFPATVTRKVGNLRMTPYQERAVIAYLKAMTDR